MIEQTKEVMHKLKFYGMLESLDVRLHEAQSQEWSHSDLLSALFSDERHYRNEKATVRRIRQAKFRTDASIDHIDFRAKRSITKAEINELKHLSFITEPRNVLLLGQTGVGKTFIATAIGNHACKEGYKVVFMGMNMFIEETAMARAAGKYLTIRKKLISADLLILDDLGIKALPASAMQDLYDILEERYQNKSTIVTSQLPIKNWIEVIDDQVTLEAILDRLIHGAIKMDITGDSYRKKRGKK